MIKKQKKYGPVFAFLFSKVLLWNYWIGVVCMRQVRNIGILVIVFISIVPTLCTAASLLITWNANSDADLAGYKVYYGTQARTYGTVVDVQRSTSYSISNVQSGSTYYVTVASYDNSGNESSKSTELSAYIPVIVPASTDTTAPTGSVVINAGAATTTTSAVTLTLSASDAGGTVTGMKISNDGVSYSSEAAYGTSRTWTLSSGYGNKTVYVLFKDSAGNWMKTPATDTIQRTDTTAPTGSVVINAGAATTTTSAVTLTLSASDAGGTVTGMKISNDGVSYSSEAAYGTSRTWTLSSGYGNKTVYVLFKDSAGNWMKTPATDTIQRTDTTAPTGSVVINAGAATTTTSAVTLTLSASDAGGTVTGMKISNDGVSYSSEAAYGTSRTWTLSSGYGNKTVYVLFKDSAGNWMKTPATDTIQRTDTTAPTGSVVINAGAATTTTSAVTLTLSASDAGGTVTGMKISNDGVSYSSELIFTTSYAWTLSSGNGKKTVYVLFKDSAGNWMTSPATCSLQVKDNTPPKESESIKDQPENSPLITPVIISPENNAVDVSLTPVLKTTDLADNYRLTEWEISNDKGDVLLNLKSAKQRTELVVPELILDVGMKHYCRVKFYDDQNNGTQWSDPVAFETVQIDPADLNKNGIPDEQELLLGEDVDLDSDGVSDRDQENMKALVTSVGEEYVSLKMSTNCKVVRFFKSIDPASIHDTEGKPGALPIGLIDFKVEVVTPGDFAEVVINLSDPAPQGALWYTYDETNGWKMYPHVAFSEDRKKLTIQLKDGDPDYGDTDGVANGIIIDPGGIGAEEIQQVNADTSTDKSSNSGCFIDTSMHHPSSQGLWAAILLILLLFSSIDRYRKKIAQERMFFADLPRQTVSALTLPFSFRIAHRSLVSGLRPCKFRARPCLPGEPRGEGQYLSRELYGHSPFRPSHNPSLHPHNRPEIFP